MMVTVAAQLPPVPGRLASIRSELPIEPPVMSHGAPQMPEVIRPPVMALVFGL